MKLKRSKCEFHKRETEYLGFIINNEGVKVDPVKTAAIWDWKPPTNQNGIQEWDSATSIDDLSKGSAGRPNPYKTESRKTSNGNGETKNKQHLMSYDKGYAKPQC